MYILEANPLLISKYSVCGAAELVCVSSNNTIPVRLLNFSPRQVKLYRCSTLGTLNLVDDTIQVFDLEETDTKNITDIKEQKKRSNPFTPDLSKTTLNTDEQARLINLLNDYHDVFARSQEELGRTSVVQHHIDTGNNPPVRQRPYRTPQLQREQIDSHIKEMKLKQENATLRAQLNQVRTNYHYLWQEYQFCQTDRATARRSRRSHIASPYNRYSPPYCSRRQSHTPQSPTYSPRRDSSSSSRSHTPLSPTYSPRRNSPSSTRCHTPLSPTYSPIRHGI